MIDLLKAVGERIEDGMDAAERNGRLEPVVVIGLLAVAFYVLAGDEAPLWLVILAAVWPGRALVRLKGHVLRAWRAREERRPVPARTLEEMTLAPLPDPPTPESPAPPPSFAPRKH